MMKAIVPVLFLLSVWFVNPVTSEMECVPPGGQFEHARPNSAKLMLTLGAFRLRACCSATKPNLIGFQLLRHSIEA